jgi:4-alpha-glucanotransferase
MKLHFKIQYNTVWGQRLLLTGNIPALGNGDYSKALKLGYSHPGSWSGTIDVSSDELNTLHYQYVVFDENLYRYIPEWGDMRKINQDLSDATNILCVDVWNEASALENTLSSAPFEAVLLRDEHHSETIIPPAKYSHYFRVKAPLLPKNQVLCMIGNCKALGNWSVRKPLLLKKSGEYWHAYIDLSKCEGEIQYKYGFYDPDDDCFCGFEDGHDRPTELLNDKKSLVQHDDGFVHMAVPAWKGAGVGLPVFSIRTRQSFGVGDFVDMKLFIDWSARVGMKLIQVLPLNDTIGTHTDADVLPYAAITAFALNPLFLNLPAMGKLPATHPLQKEYKKKQLELNERNLVDFLEVINFKMAYARELYFVQKDKFLKNKAFQHFLKDSEYWIGAYAVFCVLRDKYGSSDYRQWGEHATFNQAVINEMTAPESPLFDEVAINYFIQFHLHVQLSEAHAYAHEQGIVLKGDIPIGVNRNSVDTWAYPELFHLDKQAGAPPDMFSVKGQNWELPTYNWEAIKRTGFEWWNKRFEQMSNYFDTFRVDHILGFFRIWQIPMDQVEGVMGSLYPSVPVHINEFAERGVYFDYNRYCRPYVTDNILWDFFGDESGWVKTNCLQVEDGWVLRLKPEYCSQKFVEKLYNDGLISERVKWGLFDLISNVLFFEEAGSNGTRFYPRFGMQAVRSFTDLDEYTRLKLDEIYIDYYFKRQDAHWYKSGMEKLPALKRSTNMLICGEDLGLMTRCVTEVMKELSILSLEVQRAPKTNTIEFFHPADAPYLSVVTPSTHDMSTIRGWWEEDRGVTQRFYNQQLGHGGDAPWFCEWWICRDILLQHLYSPAMWAIFQMQDLLSISEKIRHENPHDERINVPSNSLFSWRYRLHLNLEDLLANDEFNDELRNYVMQSGRG